MTKTPTLMARLRTEHASDLILAIEGGYDSNPIFGEAADEIERLQQDLNHMRGVVDIAMAGRERARAALEKMAQMKDVIPEHSQAHTMLQMALEGLAGSDVRFAPEPIGKPP